MRLPAKTRTCAGCGKKTDKSELLRISKSANGDISVSAHGGRGVYICKSSSCLMAAIKKKRLSSVLRTQVDQKVYDRLSNLIGCDCD